MSTKEGVADLIDKNGIQSDKDKTETLNDFFNSVFTEEKLQGFPTFNPKSKAVLADLKATRDEVYKNITTLNPTKSQGPEGIHPTVLKEMSDVLALSIIALPLSII